MEDTGQIQMPQQVRVHSNIINTILIPQSPEGIRQEPPCTQYPRESVRKYVQGQVTTKRSRSSRDILREEEYRPEDSSVQIYDPARVTNTVVETMEQLEKK